MRRNSGPSFRNSGAYTSPGTPEYGDDNVGEFPKTWSSERVPLPTSSSSNRRTRHVAAAAALMPFNGGRALPSKWDDAERWITSPISGYGAFNTSIAQPQRRPKSKSGPLGPAGLVYLPSYSPTVPAYEGPYLRNFVANSPLTTGVLVPDGLSVLYEAGIGAKSNSFYAGNNMTRTASVPGLSDFLSETSLPNSQDDKLDGAKDEEALGSRRDMATQMSPDGSAHSSSKGRLSFSALPSTVRTSHENHAGKDDVRDVQVDKGTTTARQSKKQKSALRKTDLRNVEEDLPSAWEASKNISKFQREEAKIIAWENLQKAKAEAAVQKLEMKLEKRRSASMDRITSKLRGAQLKARAMRNSMSHQAPRGSSKGMTRRIFFKLCTVCDCFVCGKR